MVKSSEHTEYSRVPPHCLKERNRFHSKQVQEQVNSEVQMSSREVKENLRDTSFFAAASETQRIRASARHLGFP